MSATNLDKQFKNGKGESLARARAAIKGRLKQQMMQDVLDELQDTEHVVNEAMEVMAAKEDVLEEAKNAFKTRLHDQIRRQALDEVVADFETANFEDEGEDGLLAEAKDAFKKRLYDHVLQQAISEVGAEMEASDEAMETHGEALSEAKEAFKARLRDQVFEQAVAEAGAEVSEAQDAFETHGGALDEAKEAFKARLRDQAFEQAMDEVGAEVGATADELLAQVDMTALTGVKETLKQRLLDQVLQQAIAEIDAEVDVSEEDLAAFVEGEDEAALPEDLSEYTLEMSEEEAFSSAETLFPDEEEAFPIDDEAVESEDDPIIDVQFWDEEEAAADEADDASIAFSMPEPDEEDAPEGNESGFFLNDLSEEAGGDGEADLAEEWDEAAVDDLLDLAGDGAWEETVPYSDSLAEAEVETEAEAIGELVNEAMDEEDADEGLVYYVYGILPRNSTAEDALPLDGIEPSFPIYPLVKEQGVALVSKVSADEYGAEALAVNQLDPVWKEEREKAHETIAERFSVDGLFLPVPFCTIYESEDDVAQLFAEINYEDALAKVQDRSQIRVKLYRNVDVLHQQVVENSDAVQKLMADIKSKPKGGAHSIKKQMVSTIHEEEASLTDECTKDVHERLFGHADDVELGILDGEDDRDKIELILDATYLVHQETLDAFTEDIEGLVGEYTTRGFEFEVTGPEPPTLFSQLHPSAKA